MLGVREGYVAKSPLSSARCLTVGIESRSLRSGSDRWVRSSNGIAERVVDPAMARSRSSRHFQELARVGVVGHRRAL
jgi:hypothetical protein